MQIVELCKNVHGACGGLITTLVNEITEKTCSDERKRDQRLIIHYHLKRDCLTTNAHF